MRTNEGMKRLLWFLVCFCLSSVPVFASCSNNTVVGSIVCVQSTVGAASAITATFGSNLTSGNAIISCARTNNSGSAITFSDNNGMPGTWTTVFTAPDVSDGAAIICGIAPGQTWSAGATTVTATINNGMGAVIYVYIAEYAGLATSSPFDTGSSNVTFQSMPPYDSGSVTTVAAHELGICIGSDEGGAGTLTFTGGCVSREAPTIADQFGDLDTGAGTTGIKAQFSNTANFDNTLMVITTFKVSGGAVSPPSRMLMGVGK